ncbi:hypothetical protein F5Y08DRAFT_215328 [Xylaria arbuscula]|nr:hypothetical protein F5Y08DRAFT_215328 [Xylaria arbuscula]
MDYNGAPQFIALANSILGIGKALYDVAGDTLRRLVSTITPEMASFKNVMRVLLDLENEFQLTSNVISIHTLVASDAELRTAAVQATEMILRVLIESKADKTILQLVEAVYQKLAYDETLDLESRKALTEEKRSRRRSAVSESVNGNEASIRCIQQRLKDVETELLRNLDEGDSCLWFLHEGLDGVPEDILSSLERGTGARNGYFKLNLNGMHSRLLLSIASSSRTRKSIYLENVST